jgi:hypothetical protein
MKTYKGHQFKSAVAELIKKIAKDNGHEVKIYWEASIPTAGIDNNGRLYLADVADGAILSEADLTKYVGFGVHEILHAKYTDFSQGGNGQYLDQLHNAVEDAWIEREGIAASVTGNINGLLSTLVDGMVQRANAEVQDWADPRQYPFALAVYLRDHAAQKTPLADGLGPIFAGAKDRLVGCKSSLDTLQVARWLMDELNMLPENPPQKPQDEATSPDQGEGEGEGEGKDNKGSDGPQSKAKPVGPARRPAPGEKAVEVEPTLEAPLGKGGIGSYSEDASLVQPLRHLSRNLWMLKDVPVPAKLRYEVKRLFDDSGINEFQRNRRSGSVNVHALTSAGYNDKVFKRRNEVEGVDTCVAILLDVSGSMFSDGSYDYDTGYNSRITTAVQACIALLETLKRAQVATTLLSFGTGTAVQKTFETSTVRAIEILRNIGDGGSTNDYFAVRYAHKLLLNRPEQRKICFVLTDGDGHISECKEQVAQGDRLGITTIGIGIEHNVRHVYSQNATVKNLSDLSAVSFKQIKLAAV